MIKKIFLFPLLLLTLCFIHVSCSDNDDKVKVDEEWKALNKKRFDAYESNSNYHKLSSPTQNGIVYWTESSIITDSDKKKSLKIEEREIPQFTDTVVVRYEGWFLDKERKQIIFDSTENPSLSSRLDYSHGVAPSIYPNKNPVKITVSFNTGSSYTVNQIDGVSTLLQNMKVGEEREVVIPQELGYGANPMVHKAGTNSYTIAPAYTTLWFRLKLLQIIPMSGTN